MAAGEHGVERISGKGTRQNGDDKQPSYSFHVEECDGLAEIVRTSQSTIFQPFFLRRSTLIAVSALFLAEVVALIALVAYSARNNGLLPVRPALHQLWKYGPTAVLLLMISIWTQTEYRSKQLLPWKLLLASPESSRDAALGIDYFSKLNVVVLFESLKHRHWSVAVAVLGTLTLELAIVFSTGLLERQQYAVSLPVGGFSTTAAFSSELRINDNETVDEWWYRMNPLLRDATDMANSTLSPVVTRYPKGTTESIAYQPVDVPDNLEESTGLNTGKTTFTTTLQYFAPKISCRTVVDGLTYVLPLDNSSLLDNSGIAKSSPTTRSFSLVQGNTSVQLDIEGVDLHYGSSADIATDIEIKLNATILPPGQRNISFKVTGRFLDGNSVGSGDRCGYGILDSRVNCLGPSNKTWMREQCDEDTVVISAHRQCHPQQGYTATNMTLTVIQCRADDHFGDAELRFALGTERPPAVMHLAESPRQNDKSPFGRDLVQLTFNEMLRSLLSERSTLVFLNSSIPSPRESWTNGSHLGLALENIYPHFAVQYFHTAYFIPASAPIPVIANGESSRLSVQALSCILITCFLLLMASFGFYLAALQDKPRPGLFSVDPTTIAAAATTLSRIHASCDDFQPSPQSAHQGRDGPVVTVVRWWKPWGTTVSSQAITVMILAVLIAVTEATLIISTRNGGLATASLNSWALQSWTMVPALIVSGVALIAVNLEFNFRVLYPFGILARGGSTAIRGLFTDQVYGLVPSRLWRLARATQPGPALITAGMLLACLATSMVGDLFILSDKPYTQRGYELLQLDAFNESKLYNWTYSGPTEMAELYEELTFPYTELEQSSLLPLANFTSGAYAFPRFALSSAYVTTANKSVSTTVSAANAKLNCTILNAEQAKCHQSQGEDKRTPPQRVDCAAWQIKIPSEYAGPGCPSSQLEFDILQKPCFDTKYREGLDGYKEDVAMGSPFMRGISITPDNFDSEPDCPVFMIYGTGNLGSCENSRLTYLSCMPYIQVVDVNVTFSLPDFVVDASSIAEVPSTSPRRIFNTYAINDVLYDWKPVLEPGRRRISPGADGYVGGPFEVILSVGESPPAITLDEYFATDEASRKKVIGALDALWAKGMAQIANAIMRTEPYDKPRVITGALTDYDERWVVQNQATTRVLQSLFGAALVCLVAGFLLCGRMDDIVPFPPTSIGAIAELLRESRIWARIQGAMVGGQGGDLRHTPSARSKGITSEDLRDVGIFDVPGEYRLGWWNISTDGSNVPVVNGEMEKKFGIDFDVSRG